MKILVDADACPVKAVIVKVAREKDIPVVMVCDTAHIINDGYSSTVTVDKGADSADFALINLAEPKDLVITQDYGVAAMALSRKSVAINQNGLVYTNENIDRLLMERHVGAKARKSGVRTKGPSKRTRDDDKRFETALRRLIGEKS